MKASIKFREDQKPLLRAKIPLNIQGFPFQSGIVAGESKETSLNLATFFHSGPSLKIAYRPNDSLNPFALVFKTGIGHFGSPISSPMTMSAEFNLVGYQNPRFFVHFKPRFGDFCVKKSISSDFVKIIKSKSNGTLSDDGDELVEVIDSPMVKSKFLTENGLFSGDKIEVSPIGGLLSGTEVSAKTVLPLMNRVVVNFRWGLRFPVADVAATARKTPAARISFQNLPLLAMNKIGIEHVADEYSKRVNSPGTFDAGETLSAVKSQLELMQVENGMLMRAVEELKSEFVAGKSASSAAGEGVELGTYRGGERGGKLSGFRADRRSYNGDRRSPEPNGFGGAAREGDVNEELKAALVSSTGA